MTLCSSPGQQQATVGDTCSWLFSAPTRQFASQASHPARLSTTAGLASTLAVLLKVSKPTCSTSGGRMRGTRSLMCLRMRSAT